MQVRTFRGPSTRAVMRKIKDELGPDAIILSTQSLQDNGHPYCEATAVAEAPNVKPQPIMTPDDVAALGWPGWQREWSVLKDQLLSLLKPQMSYDCLTPKQKLILEHLEREGVDPETLLTLWGKFKNLPLASPLVLLSELITTKPFDGDHWPAGVHAFTGPHGVGKTSILLRLALKEKALGKNAICLVNADTSQGKGRVFLRHYAELSGFDFRELTTVEDWHRFKTEIGRFRKVFIDLPGLDMNETLQDWVDNSGAGLLKAMHIHLCLSPSYSSQQLKAFSRKFASPWLGSLIWTKLDEACNYGALVDMGLFSNIPVSVLSYGPGLKNCLSPARDDVLWKLILRRQFPGVRHN